MERKSKKKVMAIVAAVVIVILVSVQGIILLLQKRYAGSQELSKIANAESEEMLASLTEDEKIEKMNELSKSWDENIVSTEKVDLYSAAELRVNNRQQVQVPIPIPKGYVLSGLTGEKTVGSGVVIYEGTESVTSTSAQTTRNQWVWVPIYDVSQIYGTDSNGQLHGKLYEYNSSGRTKLNWNEEGGVMTVVQPTNKNQYYREPDITNYDKDIYLPQYVFEGEREGLEKEFSTNLEKTINSIKKYGGFYIGRYETGNLSGEAKVVKQNNDISNQNWYTMYEKSKDLRGNNRNVETGMIWGCLWDATLQWLVDTSAATYSNVGIDSSSWGSYNSSKRTTGYSESWKKNNIYDIAGNMVEWTLEASGDLIRVCRGGSYTQYGTSVPADFRNTRSPDSTGNNVGTRAVLFIALGTDSDE